MYVSLNKTRILIQPVLESHDYKLEVILLEDGCSPPFVGVII